MPVKDDCICEPLEVDGPQPLQNEILMKDIRMCIDVLKKAKDSKYRIQYLHLIREERYHLLNLINKLKAESQGNRRSSKEDLERDRFLKEMEIELEKNKVVHIRKEWARQQNCLARIQEDLYRKCRLLSLHSNYASVQGYSLGAPLAVLLEKKEVVEFFLDDPDTYLVSFVEIAGGSLSAYTRTYAYDAPTQDSPDTGFILAIFTCVAHIAALPNGRQFLMNHKECQDMVCAIISNLPKLRYCSTRKIRLALVKVLHNLGRSKSGPRYLWNCEELPIALNQVIDHEFEPNAFKLILEMFSELTKQFPDEERFIVMKNNINKERLSELALSKYTGVNHLPKIILNNIDRADRHFEDLRERQKLEDLSKHSMKKFDLENLFPDDDSWGPGANCRRRVESYEKCTCNQKRPPPKSKSETCIWAWKKAQSTQSTSGITLNVSCTIKASRAASNVKSCKSIDTSRSSVHKSFGGNKDGKSQISLTLTTSTNIKNRAPMAKSSRKSCSKNSSSAIKTNGSLKKISSTVCQCAPKKSTSAQRSSKVQIKTSGCAKNKPNKPECPNASKSSFIKSGSSQLPSDTGGPDLQSQIPLNTGDQALQSSTDLGKSPSQIDPKPAASAKSVTLVDPKFEETSGSSQALPSSQDEVTNQPSQLNKDVPQSPSKVQVEPQPVDSKKPEDSSASKSSLNKLGSSPNPSKVKTISCAQILQSCPDLSKKSSQIQPKPAGLTTSENHVCPCPSKISANVKPSNVSRRKSSYQSCNSVVSVYRNDNCTTCNDDRSVVPWTANNRQVACSPELTQTEEKKVGPFQIKNTLIIHGSEKPRKIVTRIKIKGIPNEDHQPCTSKKSSCD